MVKQNKNLQVTIPSVFVVENIAFCLVSFMIGGNDVNQDFVIDSKFT